MTKTSENIVRMRDMAAAQDDSFEDGVRGSEDAARLACFVAGLGLPCVASPYCAHVVVSLLVCLSLLGSMDIVFTHRGHKWASIRITGHSDTGCSTFSFICTLSLHRMLAFNLYHSMLYTESHW